MDLLKRSQAPILPEAWKLIDEEATRVLRMNLAGRKLVDFKGPFGWKFAAVNEGRLDWEPPIEGVKAGLRRVQPLVEVRTPIVLDIQDLDDVARGAEDPDLDEVVRAAERVSKAEDNAIFNGSKSAHITGIIEASPHTPIIVSDASSLPKCVADAKETLRAAGINGPYALALDTPLYEKVTAASEDGYPILKRIEKLIPGGQIVHAPALYGGPCGGVLLSIRGGDFELTVGQDLSIGFAYRIDHDKVELYLTESFTFRVLEPKAAVGLKRA